MTDPIYDRLMNLPLFKGAGAELITDFVEKTPLAFHRYEPGEIIASPDEVCTSVKCLIAGSAVCESVYCCETMRVAEVLDSGEVIGVEHLYGLDTKYGMSVKAHTRCGIMEFDKTNYIRLLVSSQLLLVNFLNYLSRQAQNSLNALRWHEILNQDAELSCLVQTVTSPRAREIRIQFLHEPIRRVFENKNGRGTVTIDRLIEDGLVVLENDHVLFIPSRANLISAFHRE